MKLAIVFIAACALSSLAAAQIYTKPYVKSDGTFVPGHVRSAPAMSAPTTRHASSSAA